MDKMKCDFCDNESRCIYHLVEKDICNDCYNEYFGDANLLNVTKFVGILSLEYKNKINELKEIAEDYHNICLNYENHCDKQEEKHLKDLNDIKEVVNMYSKGIGLQNFNNRIKPIINHIDYKINKLKENQNV